MKRINMKIFVSHVLVTKINFNMVIMLSINSIFHYQNHIGLHKKNYFCFKDWKSMFFCQFLVMAMGIGEILLIISGAVRVRKKFRGITRLSSWIIRILCLYFILHLGQLSSLEEIKQWILKTSKDRRRSQIGSASRNKVNQLSPSSQQYLSL